VNVVDWQQVKEMEDWRVLPGVDEGLCLSHQSVQKEDDYAVLYYINVVYQDPAHIRTLRTPPLFLCLPTLIRVSFITKYGDSNPRSTNHLSH
jgi:hypothetical protein